MQPVLPAASKLPPFVQRSSRTNVSETADPQQPHWPPNQAIDIEVAEGFALREASDLARIKSPLSETPQPSVLSSSTQIEESPVIDEEAFAISQDSLIAFMPPEPKLFIGRKEQLETLHKVLQEKKILVVIPEEDVFCRIGKSTLTSKYVKGGSSVLWIPARSRKALDASFNKLAKLFNLDPSKVKEYLSGQEKLIIFDGAQDPELLRDYIPQGKCQVIITSRQRGWPFPRVELGSFSPEEAVDFLCQLTQKGDRMTAKRIVEKLDCLPTSLEKAAKMLVEHQAELIGYDGLVNGILDDHNQRLKARSNLGNRNGDFIGREMGLVALEEALKTHSRAVITGKRRMAAEVGLGGVGKTQIALQYAFRNADQYSSWVWRINCDSDITLQGSYAELAEKMGVYLSAEEKKQENALIKRVNQRLERETGWLLIYDNAENQERLKGLIPNHGGHVLVTSRSPDWEDVGIPKVFKVGIFKRKESIALIQKMTSLNEEDANKLAELVKDLPIAVAQAAAYIRETKIPYTEYARIFNQKNHQLLSAQEPTDEYSKTVNITWQISIEKIEQLEKLKAETLSTPCMARFLMNLCAFLGSSNIPKKELLLPLIEHVYKRGEAALDDLDRTIEMLRNFSIVEKDENSISIHDLVQLVTRNQMPKAQQQEMFGRALVAVTRQMMEFEKDDVKTWPLSKLCMPHAMKIFDNIDLFACLELWTQSKFMRLLYGICKVFNNINQTLKVSQRCLIVAKELQKREPTHPDIPLVLAGSLENLGSSLLTYGNAKEALEHHTQALKIWKACFGDSHLMVAMSLHNAGSSLLALERNQEALEHHGRALEIQKNNLGNSHPDVAMGLNNVGSALLALGKADEALERFTKAKEIAIICRGNSHPDVAIYVNNMGAALHHLKKPQKALEAHQLILGVRKACYGESHPQVAMSLTNIGLTLADLGKEEEALEYHKQALMISIAFYGEFHPDVVRNLYNIAGILWELGRVEESLERYRQLYKIASTLYGELHIEAAKSFLNIWYCLRALGREQEAQEHFAKAKFKIRFKD